MAQYVYSYVTHNLIAHVLDRQDIHKEYALMLLESSEPFIHCKEFVHDIQDPEALNKCISLPLFYRIIVAQLMDIGFSSMNRSRCSTISSLLPSCTKWDFFFNKWCLCDAAPGTRLFHLALPPSLPSLSSSPQMVRNGLFHRSLTRRQAPLFSSTLGCHTGFQ